MFSPTPRYSIAFLGALILSRFSIGGQVHPFDQRPQPWKRRAHPILSANTTEQSWCKVLVYSPMVLHVGGKFRMWYVGTSSGSRIYDMGLGYAESEDGVSWQEFSGNPILTGEDIPFGAGFQTPFVLYDEDEERFRMWFVVVSRRDENGALVMMPQTLGYASGRDGISWEIHPEPLYSGIRSPMVIKNGAGDFTMYANSGRHIVGGIYRFASTDGLQWERDEKPVITPSNGMRSVVYPWVLKEGQTHYMWYGCHVTRRDFELFCASSKDGDTWDVDHSRSAFPAAAGDTAFDSRYTSTPCVLRHGDRYFLYYSARDWQEHYIDGNGKRQHDAGSPYAHIGVATLSVSP